MYVRVWAVVAQQWIYTRIYFKMTSIWHYFMTVLQLQSIIGNEWWVASQINVSQNITEYEFSKKKSSAVDGMVGQSLVIAAPWLQFVHFSLELWLLSVQCLACSIWVSSHFLKHAGRWIDYTKLPLGVNVCVWMCVCMVSCDGLIATPGCIPTQCS